ncbi:hypothetical protein [Bacillus sp. T3]|uniref:hypothetical protein n=1 Tax=Bacillus sp. T3 TaxID=467262 RepID=UPI0029826B84|nr:hypothetical protein [Bacillus sp. T3]
MAAPELMVENEGVEEVAEKPDGVFTKFVVLILLPTVYTLGLGMLLLHFSGVNIHTQVETIENVVKPLIGKMETSKKTAPTKENKETDSNKTLETSVESPNASSNNDSTQSESENQESQNEDSATETNSSQSTSIEASESIVAASQIYANLKPEQIATIFKGINNNEEILREFKKLDPKTASQVIILLDPNVARLARFANGIKLNIYLIIIHKECLFALPFFSR